MFEKTRKLSLKPWKPYRRRKVAICLKEKGYPGFGVSEAKRAKCVKIIILLISSTKLSKMSA